MHRYYITKEIKDRDLLLKVLKNELSEEQFNEAIEDLLKKSDSELVGDVFYIGFLTSYFNKKNENAIREILQSNIHKTHEDIVSLFQLNYNNNSGNIPALLNSLDNIPEYLRPDDFKYPYIRKIIYAIGAQPEPYNIEALEKLSIETSDEQIKELALYQIKNVKNMEDGKQLRIPNNHFQFIRDEKKFIY